MQTVTRDLRAMDVSANLDHADFGKNTMIVDLYGGPSNACGAVHFTFTNPQEFDRQYYTVLAWAASEVPLALVTDETQIILLPQERYDAVQAGEVVDAADTVAVNRKGEDR